MASVEMPEEPELDERQLAALLRVLRQAPAPWREAARAIPRRGIDAVPAREADPSAPQNTVPEATGASTIGRQEAI